MQLAGDKDSPLVDVLLNRGVNLIGQLKWGAVYVTSTLQTRSQSSQLAEPLKTDAGLKSGISVRELISTLKKKKSAGRK